MSTTIEEITPVVDFPDPELTGADILLLAADLIEKRGRCKHKFVDAQGRLCPLGAIRVAANRDPLDDLIRREDAAYKAETMLRHHVGSIAHWNDEEVFSLFGDGRRKVARQMREAARCA